MPDSSAGCRGIPFTCDDCHVCDGEGCELRADFCQVAYPDGNPLVCLEEGHVRHDNQCFVCQSGISTAAHSFKTSAQCNDGNLCTYVVG